MYIDRVLMVTPTDLRTAGRRKVLREGGTGDVSHAKGVYDNGLGPITNERSMFKRQTVYVFNLSKVLVGSAFTEGHIDQVRRGLDLS